MRALALFSVVLVACLVPAAGSAQTEEQAQDEAAYIERACTPGIEMDFSHGIDFVEEFGRSCEEIAARSLEFRREVMAVQDLRDGISTEDVAAAYGLALELVEALKAQRVDPSQEPGPSLLELEARRAELRAAAYQRLQELGLSPPPPYVPDLE